MDIRADLEGNDRDLEKKLDGTGDQPISFTELLVEYEPEPLHRGQYVEGEILQIDDKVILANVDAKRTAVIPPGDLEKIEEDELAKLSVGDEVPLFVLRTPVGGEDLLVSLNKGLEKQDWMEAREYLANEELLELEVIGHNKGGLLVAFGHLRGFVPISHVPQLHPIQDPNALVSGKARLVGKELPLKVIEVDPRRRRLVLSAKRAQQARRQKRLQELEQMIGESLVGRVTTLADFGAFVDLGGIVGLIHISEMAWHQVNDPAEILTPNEEVAVKILSVDAKRSRISLSRKALLPNPWEEITMKRSVGDLVEGEVTSVVDFGAFVRLSDNIEGLLHVSQMHGAPPGSPQEVLQSGDKVLVRIISIEPERERLGLSQKQVSSAEEMEWIWQKQQSKSFSDANQNGS